MLRLAIATIVISVACAPSPGAESATRPTRPPRRSHVLISSEELAATPALDAMEAVRTLRPDWLTSRGVTTLRGEMPELLVYLDGQRMGSQQVLSGIAIAMIREIRYYSAPDATQRWGTGHAGGVIEIVSRQK